MKFSVVLIFSLNIFLCHTLPITEKNSHQNALLDAIKSGNSERFQQIISDFGINTVFEGGRKISHHVAEFGDETILNVLIKNGGLNFIATDNENLTPIHLAAINPNVKVLATLMELGGDEIVNVEDNFKNTPLHLGALNENEEIVEVLLAHGADVNKLNSDQESVLHWSSINGNEKVANIFIEADVPIDQKNNDEETSLHFAALNSNVNVAESLIKAGANVNAIGRNSWTPIFSAIVNGDKKITEMLMKTSNKNYAKSLALDVILKHSSNPIQEHANIKILKLLLSYGADINHSLSDGTLPLHVALAIDDYEMFEFLIELDADMD